MVLVRATNVSQWQSSELTIGAQSEDPTDGSLVNWYSVERIRATWAKQIIVGRTWVKLLMQRGERSQPVEIRNVKLSPVELKQPQ